MVRAERRKLVWGTTDQSVNIPAGQISNTNLLAALSVAGSSLLGVTVMRTHCRIMQLAAVAGTTTRVGFIIGRTSDVGINIAGQQDPSNPELDWMLLDRRTQDTNGAATNATQNWVYDLKSKRKMQELNQAYILAITNTTAAAVTYQLWARVLVALP
jgi:hypothetical protein